MARITKNAAGAMGIILLTIIYLIEAIKTPFGAPEAPGPGFMPVSISLLILVLCIFNGAIELKRSPQTIEDGDLWAKDGIDVMVILTAPFKAMAALLLYAATLGILGFNIATPILLYYILRVMEYKSRWASLLATIIIMVLTNLIFGVWFGIVFPSGILG